jgi:hypothetical protein
MEIQLGECTICLSENVNLISPKGFNNELKCVHFFCDDCWRGTATLKPLCPLCRENLYDWMKTKEYDIGTESIYDNSTYPHGNDDDDLQIVRNLLIIAQAQAVILLSPVYVANFEGYDHPFVRSSFSLNRHNQSHALPIPSRGCGRFIANLDRAFQNRFLQITRELKTKKLDDKEQLSKSK